MRIIYEGEFVKRDNAIVAIFIKFLAAFTVRGCLGENIAMLQTFSIFFEFWAVSL